MLARIVWLVVGVGSLTLDTVWCRSTFPGGFNSAAGYAGSCALFMVAVIGMTGAVVPRAAWRALPATFVVAFGWTTAAFLGFLFTICDIGMSPYLVDLLTLLPTGLLDQPLGPVYVIIGSFVLGIIALGVWRAVGSHLSNTVVAILAVASPLIFLIATAAFRVAGRHPVSGNCAI